MTTPIVATTTNAAASNTINSGLAGIADNYQTFLSLLTTQLKNQDPLSPLDTNQFTQQLTQMTGVEQQLLSNQLLQQLVNQNQSSSSLVNSVGLIGKAVSVNGDSTVLAGGKATWAFSLPTTPSSMSVSVVNANNKVVWSGDVTPSGAGAQTFTWDGKDAAGKQTADGGTFTLNIAAKNTSGAAITASTTMQGTATAVQQVAGTTMVTVNGVQTPLSSIIGVSS
jgi:flagellar basal-body rod modification protein FlgD